MSKKPTYQEAEQEITDQGFVPIGRGQFTKNNSLAWVEEMPTGRFKVCKTFNAGR